jgi:hypothetical protein
VAVVRPAFLDALRASIDRLEACKVRYMLSGALAIDAYALPRTTYDIDIAVSAAPEELACFERGFLLEEEGTDMFGQRTRSYHPATNPSFIEVFLTTEPYPLRALGRRRAVMLESLGKHVWLIAPEDLVVMKLLQSRQPGRLRAKAAQDLVDIEMMVQVRRGKFDEELMRREADAIGVLDDLQRFL